MALTDQDLVKIAERFRGGLVPGPNGCLEWTGSRTKAGHGIIARKKGNIPAHRAAYALANGGVASLLKGMYVRQNCDNPACCNPDHLVLLTPEQSVADARERGRGAVGERTLAAKLTDDAVREIRSGDGSLDHVCAMMLKYRVSESTVRMALAGKSWAHVK